MPIGTKPQADIAIDESMVRALLGEQHPDLAHLPLASVGEGWDNRLFRLGDKLAVRLPRRATCGQSLSRAPRPKLMPIAT